MISVIDRERIIIIQKIALELLQKYRNEYSNLKKLASSDFEKCFWSKGWREAYAPDYINEISDNTQEARKILSKEPRKKAYTSLHCYSKNKPVISLFYGNDGNLCMEKFFVEIDNIIVGICYKTNDGNIYSLSVETRNAHGLPHEYTVCYTDMNFKHYDRPLYLLRSTIYNYDVQNLIISASYVDRLKINIVTDNTFANAVPENLEDYIFLYDNETVTHFTRINYSENYEKKTEHTWKFDRWILKRYKDDGISCFG